jgi:hypothetical protein
MASDSPHQSALSVAIRALSASRAAGCILDARGSFLFVNEAWQRLPPEAGGPPVEGATLIGVPFADAASPALRQAYGEAIADALASRGRVPRVLAGEWNDGETARLVSTRIDPLVASDGVIGLVLRRAVVRERPVDEVYGVEDRGDEAYRDATGAVAQCACCRRVRDATDPSRWDFVPRLAAGRADAAADLCDFCAELHVGVPNAA